MYLLRCINNKINKIMVETNPFAVLRVIKKTFYLIFTYLLLKN